jgi:uncharacterized RDD family membrane protein YckC
LNGGLEATQPNIPAWKQELNERLAATRARRSRLPEQQSLLTGLEDGGDKSDSRAAQLAARVAARFANAPSYSEMLAIEARAAAQAAEMALNAAQEAHAAAQALVAGLETSHEEFVTASVETMQRHDDFESGSTPRHHSGQWGGEFSSVSRTGDGDVLLQQGYDQPPPGFLADPLEEVLVSPTEPLPVNLIQFPRELVAARRARPRLAEGPLRMSPEEAAHDESQLRIFEVERENIPVTVKLDSAPTEWSSIRLDARPSTMPREEDSSFVLELPLKVASLEDRLMAGLFDVALVLLAFVLFVLVFAASTAHPPAGKSALAAAAIVLGSLFVLYQYLFFRFTDGTPGMRYAKIALCTFEDENPSRKAMRRRIWYLVLSAAPFGLGLWWAWLDEDHLGWHDRMTRMYQRSYR